MHQRKKWFIRAVCIIAVLSLASQIAGQTTTLYIYSNVCGFEVWWDGRHIFTAPPDKDWCWFYCVSAGKHTLTLKKSGCADATVVVDIVAGVKNEITVNMACGPGGSDAAKDSDGDGVPDSADDCYNKDCSIVDSRGCPKDSDSDGLNDCEDQCRYEKGPVSNEGCPEAPSDEDNDGIPDNQDGCYNPECAIVDSQGCPKDYDSDGLNDCEDQCRYEKGPVSNNGCPEDLSGGILKYWWVIPTLVFTVVSLIYKIRK